MLRTLKRRVANWLLRGVELEELRVRRLKAGERTVTLGDHIDVGDYTFGGVAWAPTRDIELVEVRIDDGPWQPAELSVPLSTNSWVQWAFKSEITAGPHTMHVRATDGTGETQGETRVRPRPNGVEGWHMIRFVGVE